MFPFFHVGSKFFCITFLLFLNLYVLFVSCNFCHPFDVRFFFFLFSHHYFISSFSFYINWIRIMHLLWLLDGSILLIGTHHIAYFRVHSRANSLYFSRSVLYILAISGTNGSSGFGSHSREQMDKRTRNKINETVYLLIIIINVNVQWNKDRFCVLILVNQQLLFHMQLCMHHRVKYSLIHFTNSFTCHLNSNL